ncbi:MAG: phosphate signaling complex protein PhoU [Anaerolineales bacterium]|nr:phosphate signaling complex protein PhoU [Anaerolineales bacterium]
MTRAILNERLQQLQDEVLSLGSIVGQAAVDSVRALSRSDTAAAKELERRDRLINTRRFEIERECLALIATQQPMAHDLRLLAAVLEVITELERMGDYVKGIAHITVLLRPFPPPPDLFEELETMAINAGAMLRCALDAFAAGDERAARAIPQEDDEVDRSYARIFQMLTEWINSHPDSIDPATRLLWVAHNLERFADRVTNICERTIFTICGEMVEFSSSGGD